MLYDSNKLGGIMSNTTVFDVARYILEKYGPMSAMKLQKLVYYSQAWSLVWDDKPLFDEQIEAWVNGPVIRELYNEHKGMFLIDAVLFQNKEKHTLNEEQRDTINEVLKAYLGKSAQWLSDQTHSEQPWILAREGLSENERGGRTITLASMAEYYEGL
jgi:uncharacterized phage-associated protein